MTTHTIQVWDRQGRIRCPRLPTGRRRVPESEIRRLMNIAEQRKEAAYATVSSHDQRSDLDSQVKVLKARAPGAEVYSDIRSGLNFKRKDLLRLLDDVLGRKVSRIYVTYEDRLASLAILCRGLRLCGLTPFAVSADASWQQMRDEYLYPGSRPDVLRTGWTDAASVLNLDVYTKIHV
ncbi:MAG: recombinase family protein [Nitrososphaerota archaeon]|nr:recombinase family protein [Nitrososphaerota archaeon]